MWNYFSSKSSSIECLNTHKSKICCDEKIDWVIQILTNLLHFFSIYFQYCKVCIVYFYHNQISFAIVSSNKWNTSFSSWSWYENMRVWWTLKWNHGETQEQIFNLNGGTNYYICPLWRRDCLKNSLVWNPWPTFRGVPLPVLSSALQIITIADE